MPISQVINPMVNPPSISDPANFEAEAEAFLNTALQTRANEMNAFAAQANALSTEVNSLASAMNLNSTNDTSVTSNTIGTGSKTFTVSASKSYVKGMYVVIADTAAPSTNSMFGIVDSYSGTTLVVNVLAIRGSGTKTAWTISQSAAGVTAETYTRTNILGAVSQSGGVPTGAIIETGSNANGRYTKWADGTMVCSSNVSLGSVAITTANGSNYISGAISGLLFAAIFIAAPICLVSIHTGNGTVWTTSAAAAGTNSPGAFFLMNTGSVTATSTAIIFAIGRWY